VYRVRYTALQLIEVARLLNNGIDLSHISDNQFPHHLNIQSLIQRQIQQNIVESQSYQPNYQRNAFNVRPYLDSNIVGAASIPSNNNNLVNDGMHVHVASPNSYVASLNSLASQ